MNKGVFSLTDREMEVLRALAPGHTHAYIARALVISQDTVKTHVARIYQKLGVTSKDAAIEAYCLAKSPESGDSDESQEG